MEFDFSSKGKVKIGMAHHIYKVLSMFPDKIRNKVLSSPNVPKLFEVRSGSKELSPEKAKLFHTLVAQLLYIMKRTRPELQKMTGGN